MTSIVRSTALRIARLLCAALLLLPLLSSAGTLRWTVQNARFDDGGTLTGYFDFDPDTQVFGRLALSVSGGGSSFPVFTYTAANADAHVFTAPGANLLNFDERSTQRKLQVGLVAKPTAAGGMIQLQTEGSYTGFECFNCSPFRRLVGGSISGAPAPAVTSPGISGNWYDPAQSGHGFQLEVLDGNVVTAFWFTFDNAGNQVWINAVGVPDANQLVMQAGRVTNGRFPPNFNPATVAKPAWGTLTFTFADCDHATVAWTSTDPAFTPTGTMTLTRLTKLSGMVCP